MKQTAWPQHVALSMPSPLGVLTLVGNGKAVTHIRISEKGTATRAQLQAGKNDPVLLKAVRQLEQYFAGKLARFDVPLEPQGTVFQKRVWRALSRIPFGKTASYKDVAAMVGSPKAVRAVGNANGKNPICIVVPCHRVIAHDGGLGGYTGGLSKKRYLLSMEADAA